MRVWWLAMLCACGRVDFAALPDAQDPVTCPAGFIAIRGNAEVGTRDFCVRSQPGHLYALNMNRDQTKRVLGHGLSLRVPAPAL